MFVWFFFLEGCIFFLVGEVVVDFWVFCVMCIVVNVEVDWEGDGDEIVMWEGVVVFVVVFLEWEDMDDVVDNGCILFWVWVVFIVFLEDWIGLEVLNDDGW